MKTAKPWTYQGMPVTLKALAGNPQRKVIFGVEVTDASGRVLKLPADKVGLIPGLLDSNGRPVSVKDADWFDRMH